MFFGLVLLRAPGDLVWYSHCKKKKLRQHKILRQPASADFWVFSTSCFKFIQQNIFLKNKLRKSAEAGCLKILSWLNFFFFYSA